MKMTLNNAEIYAKSVVFSRQTINHIMKCLNDGESVTIKLNPSVLLCEERERRINNPEITVIESYCWDE